MPTDDEGLDLQLSVDELSDETEESDGQENCEGEVKKEERGFRRHRLDEDVASSTGYRKLTTLIAIFAILFGFILSTYHTAQTTKPKVIYANRYSKEHKFRPAASPVITETLKDGRIRIRGAEPTMSPSPRPTIKPKRKRKATKKKTDKKLKPKVS